MLKTRVSTRIYLINEVIYYLQLIYKFTFKGN